MSFKHQKIKKRLDSLYETYRGSYRDSDPVMFPRLYDSPDDIEIVAFFSALLSFGNVKQIKQSISRLLGFMGDSPFDTIKNYESRGVTFQPFKHRFVTGKQLDLLALQLSRIIRQYGSLKSLFSICYAGGDMVKSLSIFVEKLKEGTGNRGKEFSFLLPHPEKRSACKRMFLFLRWMVRGDDGIDFGLFTDVDPAHLVIPLDIHIGRISRLLGFTERKSDDLKTALIITDRLRELDPADPVKYDFALTRIGILDGCDGTLRDQCEQCKISDICSVCAAKEDQVPSTRSFTYDFSVTTIS